MSQLPDIHAFKTTVVRKRGLRRFALWLLAFLVGMSVPLFVLPRFGVQLTPPGMIPFALPGAFALQGLIELISGVPFLDLAGRWDELKGWQRGLLGTIIVLVAMVVIVGGVGLALSLLA
ncbi:MAG TPA: hypothetical protein VK961_00805 [Chthoniobacter sp.]|nr:hypothetical protein [Chthoniobacter sp.]